MGAPHSHVAVHTQGTAAQVVHIREIMGAAACTRGTAEAGGTAGLARVRGIVWSHQADRDPVGEVVAAVARAFPLGR